MVLTPSPPTLVFHLVMQSFCVVVIQRNASLPNSCDVVFLQIVTLLCARVLHDTGNSNACFW
jgi:hypothetical protein